MKPRIYLRILLCLCPGMLLTLPGRAQPVAALSSCSAITTADALARNKDLATATGVISFALSNHPDSLCRLRLYARLFQLGYAQGRYVDMTRIWKEDSSFLRPLKEAGAAGRSEAPESEALLFASLSLARTGDWATAASIIFGGLVGQSADELRRLLTRPNDRYLLTAVLAAAKDRNPQAGFLSGVLLKQFKEQGPPPRRQKDQMINYFTGRAMTEAGFWSEAIPFLQSPAVNQLTLPERHLRDYLIGKCYNETGQYKKALEVLGALFALDKADSIVAEYTRALEGLKTAPGSRPRSAASF